MIDCSTCSVLDCKFNSTNPKKSCSMYKPYMTSKQALHCMKFNCELAACEECDVYGMMGTDHCFEDACREAIKALEKQIPKKPIIITNLMTKHVSAHCSICDTDITYYSSEENYCHNCGQAIKWE